jgi:hypothetical protein
VNYEQLKVIGKALKRDIQTAVAQGKLPPLRYSVRTEDAWYGTSVLIRSGSSDSDRYATDEERAMLLALTHPYNEGLQHPFSVMIDGRCA